METNWHQYSQPIKRYPRIVGETEEKILYLHTKANTKQVATAIVSCAFEFQGKNVVLASRVYLPKSYCP